MLSKLRSSLAPLILIISIIILLLFSFYYLNSNTNTALSNMEYVSTDYKDYQLFLYYLFVYIPFEIRYNLINLLLSQLYSNGNVYNLNTVQSLNYQQCQIPIVENLTEEKNIMYSNKLVRPMLFTSPGSNQNNIYSYHYKLCIPLLYVENYQNDFKLYNYVPISDIPYEIQSDVQNSLKNLPPFIKLKGFIYLDGSYILSYALYNFSVQEKYQREVEINNIVYNLYPYLIYYNQLICNIYNQTFSFFNFVINNQNNFASYQNYIYYNQTSGDNTYLYFSFNNTGYYALDLYYNSLLPPNYPNKANITIVLPCESFGQLYNGECKVNNTIENYEDRCLYEGSINYQNLFQGFNYEEYSQEIFNGYWYKVSSINYNLLNKPLPPDFLDCNDTVKFAKEMIGNYTYFTGGNYPILVPVEVNVNYNNISCELMNQTLVFGPYNLQDCISNYTEVQEIINSNNLNNLCTLIQCWQNNQYYFNLTCFNSQTNYLNSFNYNYEIYEWINLNDKNVNDFCNNLQ
ncbi:MAG: hypothetical protein ACP5GJ_00725 [Nanopusillaceae archaeon]